MKSPATNFMRSASTKYLTVISLAFLPLYPIVAQPLTTNGNFNEPMQNGWTVSGNMLSVPQIVDAKIEGAPITRALQLNLAAYIGANPWDVRIDAAPIPHSIAKDDVILVQFWARSTPKTRVDVVFQQSSEPYEKSIRQTASLQPDWKKFTFYAPAKSDFAVGASNFEIQLGHSSGKTEFTGLNVENLGAISVADVKARYGEQSFDYYGGEGVNDDWLPAANARIEKYRKADIKLRLMDSKGKPIYGAKVTFKQTKSAFRWGTAVNYYLLEQSRDGEKYRAILKRLFNTAVVENDIKWQPSDRNQQVQQRARATVDWLKANGFALRGHNLVWGGDDVLPYRLRELSADETRAEVKKRVVDTVATYKNEFYVWDVVNEATTETKLWDKIGWQSFPDTYRYAKATDPNALLAYNDYNISNEAPDNGSMRRRVEARVQELLDSGAPLDVLGDQGHMSVPLTPIPRVLQIWDDWSNKFKKPLEITEFDVNIADDAVHAKYTRDYLTAAFSNPNINSFLVWEFWEKAHWLGANGALFHADWSPRPAALTYENLVMNKWRTNQVLTTDKSGAVQLRCFLGDYEVLFRVNGKIITEKLTINENGLRKQFNLK